MHDSLTVLQIFDRQTKKNWNILNHFIYGKLIISTQELF